MGDRGPAVAVLLDGRVVGEASQVQAAEIATKLRTLKALGKENVCESMHYTILGM